MLDRKDVVRVSYIFLQLTLFSYTLEYLIIMVPAMNISNGKVCGILVKKPSSKSFDTIIYM